MTPFGATAVPGVPEPFRVVAFDRIDSTSSEAKRRALAGAPHGLVIWATEQTQGRGRRDRQWFSPPGNLYFSVVLRPEVAVARAAELSFVAAVSLAEAIAPVLLPGTDLALKWPNDLLIDGAKAAGILVEAQTEAGGEEADKVPWVVLGIGVNLATAPVDMPYPVTSLAAVGSPILPSMALEHIVSSLARRYRDWLESGFPTIREAWLRRARGLGQSIELRQNGTVLTGRFADLDRDGALLLDTVDGRRRITAGDVHFAAA
jgi:BirA family biotin operon repressor/biotin-[acetyl-CoA-carboxylase] ligase